MDRQADKQTDRNIGMDRQTERQTYSYGQTNRQAGRYGHTNILLSHIRMDRQVHRQTDRQTMDRQAGRYGQSDRQTDRQDQVYCQQSSLLQTVIVKMKCSTCSPRLLLMSKTLNVSIYSQNTVIS